MNYRSVRQMQRNMSKCFRNDEPPEYWEDDYEDGEEKATPACDSSWCAGCISLYEGCDNPLITADDLAEAKDELATERLEIIISNDVPSGEVHFMQHGKRVGTIFHVDTIADRMREQLAEIEGGGK